MGEGIKHLHPDKWMCLHKGGWKGEAAPKTSRRAGLTGTVLSLRVAWLAKALVGPGEDKHVGGLPDWTLTASLPMEETTPHNGMIPTWFGAANLGRMKGMHMEEEREKEEVRALKYK